MKSMTASVTLKGMETTHKVVEMTMMMVEGHNLTPQCLQGVCVEYLPVCIHGILWVKDYIFIISHVAFNITTKLA